MFVVNLASALASYTYAFIIFERIYTSKKLSIFLKIIYIAVAGTLMALLAMLDIPVLNFLYSFVSFMLLAGLFYKHSNKNYIIYTSICLLLISIMEMLALLGLSLMTGLDLDVIQTTPHLLAAAIILSWILMIALTRGFMLYVFEKTLGSIRTQEVIMVFALIVSEILLFHYLYNTFIITEARYEIVIILLIFLALDLYIAYILRTLSKAYNTEKELELLTQQSMIQLNAYKDLNEKYNASRRVIHDVKKHIASLDGLINTNKAEEAARYKVLLDAELNKLIPRFECDNPILTVVINNKLEAADALHVDFRVDAEFTDIGFISSLDITAIFSNLLDNAFEACCELPEEKRRVWLSITRRNYFVFVYLENSFDKVDVNFKNEFRSTKQNHHGLGLSNIRNACEKYSGSFNAHTEGEMFITELLIPIPDNAKAEKTAP